MQMASSANFTCRKLRSASAVNRDRADAQFALHAQITRQGDFSAIGNQNLLEHD